MRTTIEVDSLGAVGGSAERLHDLFIANREDVLKGAIFNSGLLGDVWRRTPKADRRRVGDVGGRMNLAKSIMPSGANDPSLTRIPKRVDMNSVSFVLGSDKPYAFHVHDAKKPREGEYWDRSDPSGRGWSTPNTGNKYLEKPIRENSERIAKSIDIIISQIAQRQGVFE